MTETRISAIRTRLADAGAIAFAANLPANVAYLTGFEGVFDKEPASVALVAAERLAIYTDGRYAEAVAAAAKDTAWQVHDVREGLWPRVAADIAEIDGDGRLEVETTLTVATYRRVEEACPSAVDAVEGWVEQLRRVKDAAEIKRIESAQELTDAALEYALEAIGPGVTEKTLALDVEMFLRSHGDDVAFQPIVASGPNSSRPHAVPSDREMVEGDLVVLDLGARVDGYCADMTRTVVIGSASEHQREVFEAVRAANQAGIGAIHAGIRAADADAAARAVLTEAGLGEAFTHGLGHGVGREVHELPYVSARSAEELALGEVVTVEPGVYVPGFGGVRIEDLVVVESASARLLTGSTKDLIEI